MTQPAHRIHSANEPLPVSGEGTNVDYSPDNISRLADQDQAAQRNTTTTTHCHTHSPSHIPTIASLGTNDANRDLPDRGENRFDTTDNANRCLSSTECPTETHRCEHKKSDTHTRTTDDANRALGSQETHHGEHKKFDTPIRTTDHHSRALGSQGAESTETHVGESRFDERPGLSGGNNAPYAKPGIKDKIIGKTEELAGKITRDPEMAAKGTIRSEIGKEGMNPK